MSRETDQKTVLLRVAARIVDACALLKEGQVYIVADPADPPPESSQGALICTVAPTDGRFDAGMQDGGGIHQVLEEAGVAVTLWRRNWSDRDGHAKVMLTGGAEALLDAKKQILNALAGHDLLDENDEPLLASYMAALSASAPRRGEYEKTQRPLGDLMLTFSTDFLWDLPGAA